MTLPDYLTQLGEFLDFLRYLYSLAPDAFNILFMMWCIVYFLWVTVYFMGNHK